MRKRKSLKKVAAAGLCACVVLSAQGADSLAAEMKSEAAKTEAPDVYLPESSSRYLEEEEVEGWTRGELEYARYEIFARRGMLFDDPEIAEYFSGKSWYFGFIKESDFPESMLNEYELANAELLERLAAEAEDDTEESGTEEDQSAAADRKAQTAADGTTDTAKTDDADDTQSETGEAGADEAGEAVTEEETGDAAKPAGTDAAEPDTEEETETEQAVSYVPGEYTAYADGYASKIMVTCTFDEKGIVSMGMNLSGETAGQGAEIGNDLIKSILKDQTSEVDAIAGATVTSDAVKEAVAVCMEQAKAAGESEKESESELQTEGETETETETATEAATEIESETEVETQTEAAPATETELETEAETQTEAAPAIETEPETETETETETEIVSTETETEAAIETEPGTETEAGFSRNEDLHDVDIMEEIEKMEAGEGVSQPGEETAEQQETTELQLAGTSDAAPVIEYIFPDVAERYLDRSEVSRLSPQAISYAKNEIYARHGRKFASQELKDYFGSKSWYVGTVDPDDFTDKVFNDYEQKNLLLIVEYDTYKLDQPGYDIYRVNEELSLFAAETSEATIAPESGYLSGQYIFADSDIRYLTEEEVNVLSARVACYARYEIYARRGAIFTPQELQEYFGGKNWYAGRINLSDFSSEMFNQYELYNMKLLNEREKALEPDGYLNR